MRDPEGRTYRERLKMKRGIRGVILVTGLFAGTVCAEVRVVPLPDGAISSDADVGADNTIHVAYFQDDDIQYIRSDDDGRTWSRAIQVNSESETASAGRFRGPDLAVADDGRVHVIWYTSAYQRKLPKEEWGIHYAYLAPGAEAFSEGRNLNHRPSDNYSVAVGSHGQAAAVWTAAALYVNLSMDGGETFGDAVQVAMADPCECCATRAVFTGPAELSVFYREKKDHIRDMHVIRVGMDGKAIDIKRLSSEPWKIEGCPMTGADIRRTPDGTAAVWETKRKVRFARVNVDGTLKEPGVVAVSEKGRYPTVLAGEGDTLVGWKDGSILRWAGYDVRGTATGLVGSYESGNGDRPSGVVTKDGDFVLFP